MHVAACVRRLRAVCETQGLILRGGECGLPADGTLGATCPFSNKENAGMKSRLGTSAAASSITSATGAG